MKLNINFLKALFSVLILSTCLYTQAQSNFCPTEVTMEQVKYMEKTHDLRRQVTLNRHQLQKNPSYSIPIQVHIVRNDNGSGGLSSSDLQIALDDLNNAYAPNNMVFVSCNGVNYIDETDYMTVSVGGNELATMIADNAVSNVINIYFIPTVKLGFSTVCGYATFPSSSADEVVIANDCAINGSTVPHELGHYFNLYHTHQTNNTGIERVTRDPNSSCYNCETAGDELCDTAADPELSAATVDNNCNYTGALIDPCADLYTPPTTNVMSYSEKHCRTVFTQGQLDRILTSYFVDRSYLVCCGENHTLTSPTNDAISGAVLQYEVNNSITASNTIFNGADVEYDAGNYIELIPGFEAQSGSTFEAYIDGCGGKQLAEVGYHNQKTNQIQHQSGDVEPFILRNYPTPFTSTTTIEYTLSEAATVNLEVYNLTGQRVATLITGVEQQRGTHQISFEAYQLPAGVYYYTLQAGQHRQTQKMMIQR